MTRLQDMQRRESHIRRLDPNELLQVEGGVMPVYDSDGRIIRTCTGPVDIFKSIFKRWSLF